MVLCLRSNSSSALAHRPCGLLHHGAAQRALAQWGGGKPFPPFFLRRPVVLRVRSRPPPPCWSAEPPSCLCTGPPAALSRLLPAFLTGTPSGYGGACSRPRGPRR